MKCIQITISGDIQGIGFRFNATHIAYSLNIKGFVTYTSVHDIYMEAEGEENSLESFIEWCTTGPFSSQVSGIIMKETELKNYQSFEIRLTGNKQTATSSNLTARNQVIRYCKEIFHYSL
jgi:acylphosphatase